jgi:hypothetical protein
MRRLYFLLPNVDTARKIVDELLLARIEERHMHLIAKEGISLEHLPEANLLQKTDFVPALERGMALGGMTGVAAGLVAMAFPPAGIIIGGGALMATTLIGAGMGAWVSSMIGVDVPNSRLAEYEQSLEKGDILLLVDVVKSRVEEIEAMVKGHHPEAEVHGTEPTIPAFP